MTSLKNGLLKIMENDKRKYFFTTKELIDMSIQCPYHPNGLHKLEGCLLAFIANGIPLAFKRALANKADEIKRRDKATGVPASNRFRSDGVNQFLAGTLHDELRQVPDLAGWARRTPEQNSSEICAKAKKDCAAMEPPTSARTNCHQTALHDFVCHAAVSIATTGLCRSSVEKLTVMAYEASRNMEKDTSGNEVNMDVCESFEWEESPNGLFAPTAMPSAAARIHRYGFE